MMPAEIMAAVGWYYSTTALALEAIRAFSSHQTGILRIFPPSLPLTNFYSYYSCQVNCEPAQNVFPYFPIIAALLKKRLSSFSWKPMSTLQAVQLLKQKKKKTKKRELLMSEWRKISRCTPSPGNPAGKDAVSAGGGPPAATLEACPVHSAASTLFYLFTSPRSYHAFDYVIILHSAQLKHNWSQAFLLLRRRSGGGGGGGRGRLFQLAFYYVLGINEILLFFGWKSGLSDYHANSKI